jgi:hypothetical protein
MKKLLLLAFINLLILSAQATVKVPASVFLKKLFTKKEQLFFNIEINESSDEQLLYFLKPYYKRIGELGIELNDKGRCRYHTRRKLLKVNNQNDWDCFFTLRGMVRDTKYCLHHPNQVFDDELLNESKKIKGRIRYVGVAPLPYRYDIKVQDGVMNLSLGVYYKNWDSLSDTHKATLRQKFTESEVYWNRNNPRTDRFNFKFNVLESAEGADFIVNAVDKSTRGPYLREHNINWYSLTFAHEFGHMMGLDDEYDQIFATLFKNSRCTNKSLMCSSRNDHFPKYYWYKIFRRSFCQ